MCLQNVNDMVRNIAPIEREKIPPTAEVSEELLSLGLVIPPFPTRSSTLPKVEYPFKILPTDMTQGAANAKKEEIFKLMDAFDESVAHFLCASRKLTNIKSQPTSIYHPTPGRACS